MGKQVAAPYGSWGTPPAGDEANTVLQGVILAVGPTPPLAFRGALNLAIWASFNTTLTTTAGSLSATVAAAGTIAIGSAVNGVNVPPGATVGAITGTAVTLVVPPVTIRGNVNVSDPIVRGMYITAGLVGSTVTGLGIPAGTTVLAVVTPAVSTNNAGGGSDGSIRLSQTPTIAPTNGGGTELQFTGNASQVLGGADALATFTGAGILYIGSVQVERTFDGGKTWTVCNVGGSGLMAQYNAGTPINLNFSEMEKSVFYRLNCLATSGNPINYRMSETGGAATSLSLGSAT